jgi:secondary thiamine-phosphate synthase enzyme
VKIPELSTMAMPQEKKAGRSVTGEISLNTEQRTQLLDVTVGVTKMVHDSGVHHGVCHLYVPHTTAGIMINEGADPDVARDIAAALDRMAPRDDPSHRHAEGNSDSHIKAALVGSSATVFIVGGRLELGRWQGIFFCEFDGPRERTLRIKIVSD